MTPRGLDLGASLNGPIRKGSPAEAQRARLNLCSVAPDAAAARDVLEAAGLLDPPTPAPRRPRGGRQYAEERSDA